MRKQDGTMKNTYEFLTDLHKQWGNLNNEQKTAIALQLGGKNQMEVFLATMNNFDTALNATNTAMGEQNSAAKENAKYLESLAGHLANLKSAWEEFSFKMVSSDALKQGMDILADILHFLTTDVGQGVIKLALLTTGINLLAKALLGLKGLSIVKLFGDIGKGAKEAGSGLGAISKAVKGSPLASLGSTISKLASGFLGGGGLVTGVALASVALAKFVPIGKEAEKIQLHKNMEKTRTELEDMQGRYKSLTEELETYRDMEKEGTLNKYDEERLHTLENQTEQLKQQIELKKKLQTSQAKEDYSLISEKDLTGKAHDVYAKAMSEGKSETQALAIVKQQTGVYDKLSASLDKVRNSALETAQAEKQYGRESEQYLKASEKQGNSLEELQKIRKQAIKDFGDEKTAQKELGESYVALNKEIKGLKALQAIDWKTPTKNMSKLAKNADKLGLGFDSAGKKIQSLDLGTFSRMMTEAGYDTEKTWKFVQQIGKENPEVKVNVDGAEVAISDLEYVDGAIQAVSDKEAKVNVDDSELKQAQEEWDNMTFKEREAIIKGNNKDAKKKYSEVKGYKNLEKTLTLDGENAQAKSAYNKILGLSDVYKTLHVRGEIEQSFYNAASELQAAAAKGGGHAGGRRGVNQPEELSEVNERGWEFIRDAKTGQLRVAGGGKRTVTLLKKGDEVYTHAESMRMMRNDNDVLVPQFAKGKKATKEQKKKIDKLRSQFDAKLDILEYKRDRYHWSDAYFNKQYKKLYNKYKKKIRKVKKGYGLGRERTQDYYLSRSEEKHDAAIDLLDARVEDIGYYYSLSKTLTKIKNLRKQRKISAEEAEEYRKQAYKANVEYNLRMFANDKKTLKQTRDAIKTAYKNNKISAQEYYDYLEELAQTQLDKERERIEKRKELEENRYDLARTYVQQQIDLIEKENEEQETQNELLKLQADLASARNRKIRIFKEGEGFVYERDTEAIKEATDALKEYQGEADTAARTKPWQDILDMMDAMEVEASIKSLENKIGSTTEKLFGKMGTSLVDWTNWVSQNLSTTIGLDSILEKLETLTTYNEAVKALGENLKVTDTMINKAIEKSTITQDIVSDSTISGMKADAASRLAAKLDDTTNKITSAAAKLGTDIVFREAIRKTPIWLSGTLTANVNETAAKMGTDISINNVNLPNVKDGEQFVNELKNIALQASTTRS